MDKINLLKSVFVFSGLDENLLKQLAGQLKESKVPAGSEIFKEGAPADAFFIVDSGEVTISKRIGASHEKVLAIMGPGSVFGEMAFFSDSPRTANANVKTDSVLWKIERNAFMRFIEGQPNAGLRILSGLLQVSMDRLEQTSKELATVYQTGKVISSGKDLKEIIHGINDELLLAVTETEGCAVFLYNEFNEEYDPVLAPAGARELPKNHPMFGVLLKNSTGIIVRDTRETDFPAADFLKNSRTFLIAPIIKAGSILGFMALWNSREANVFKNSHILLLLSVAGQLAEAIENLKFQQEERDRRRLNDARQTY